MPRGRPKGSKNANGSKCGRKARNEYVKLVYEDGNFKIEREPRNWILTTKGEEDGGDRVGYFGTLPAVFHSIANKKIGDSTYANIPSITAAFESYMAFKADVIKEIDQKVRNMEAGIVAED